MNRETIFSPCRKYRYTLWRSWSVEEMIVGENSAETFAHKYVQFIGLNPSTADEVQDDPTIRRCIGFAKAWGYGAMCMTNIFAYRATDPKVMKAQHPNAEGPDNNFHILNIASGSGLIVAAWGTHGELGNRGLFIKGIFTQRRIQIHHLGLTADGFPKHPLYLKKTTQPKLWL